MVLSLQISENLSAPQLSTSFALEITEQEITEQLEITEQVQSLDPWKPCFSQRNINNRKEPSKLSCCMSDFFGEDVYICGIFPIFHKYNIIMQSWSEGEGATNYWYIM